MAKVSIFGLGYVGSVSAACFANEGNQVVGVEINPLKLAVFQRNEIPLYEPMLGELMTEAYENKSFTVTDNPVQAILETDISFVCVGTPSKKNGEIDLTSLERVSQQIGEALRDKDTMHTVVVRSTVFPGSIENVVVPAIEQSSGKKEGQDFTVVSNPEFMREGSAVNDFNDPPFVIIGESAPGTGDAIAELYSFLSSSTIRLSIRAAEMVKYVCNAFHALKITFANEIGQLSKAVDVDGQLVMDTVCLDDKLNISKRYLKPGPSFGGSCLPKDLRMLNYGAKARDLELPVINSIMRSNNDQINRTAEIVMESGHREVGLVGLTFKESTDDLRESPPVMIAETLIGKGFQLKIHDPEVELTRLTGANKEYLEEKLPHINSQLVRSMEELVSESKVLVICKDPGDSHKLLELVTPSHKIVDLGGWLRDESFPPGCYYGLYW